MRILGIGLLSCCVLAMGFQAAYELNCKIQRCRTCCLFWRDVANLLAYTKRTPKEIFQQLEKYPRYGQLAFVQQTCTALRGGERFDKAYADALSEQRGLEELLPTLKQLGNVPGSSHLQAQLEQLEFYCCQLEQCVQQLEKEKQEQGRLYRSLGFAGAAFVFVLLI